MADMRGGPGRAGGRVDVRAHQGRPGKGTGAIQGEGRGARMVSGVRTQSYL